MTHKFTQDLNSMNADSSHKNHVSVKTALVTLDFYKLSKEIIDAECPTVKYGLMSWHYWLMVSIVTCSMSYDYWINSNWKIYGMANVKKSNGEFIKDQEITIVMVIASLCNAFVRIGVGRL